MQRKIAVVTGANGGIGRAVCSKMLTVGFDVVAVGRDMDALNESVDSVGVNSDSVSRVVADVRDGGELGEKLGSLENVHTLVANAGICRQSRLLDGDSDRVWREVMSTNLDGVWNTLRAAVPKMVNGGRIVIVSSGLGKLGRAGYGAYAASKHGVLGLAKCLALELALREITVNAICPGWVNTEMAAADLRRTALQTGKPLVKVEDEVVTAIPTGRMVEPVEVASMIGWLVSEEAAAVTGQAFNISGGEFFA